MGTARLQRGGATQRGQCMFEGVMMFGRQESVRNVEVRCDGRRRSGPLRTSHPRHRIHHVVVVLGVVTDGGEDQAAVAIEEPVPRGVKSPPVKLGDPVFHQPPLGR